jgi:hypothetical protein
MGEESIDKWEYLRASNVDLREENERLKEKVKMFK